VPRRRHVTWTWPRATGQTLALPAPARPACGLADPRLVRASGVARRWQRRRGRARDAMRFPARPLPLGRSRHMELNGITRTPERLPQSLC